MSAMILRAGIFKIELKDGAASVTVGDLIPNEQSALVRLYLISPVNPESNAWIDILVGNPPLRLFGAFAADWTIPRGFISSRGIEGIAIGPLVKIELTGFEQESVELGLQWVEEKAEK